MTCDDQVTLLAIVPEFGWFFGDCGKRSNSFRNRPAYREIGGPGIVQERIGCPGIVCAYGRVVFVVFCKSIIAC